MKVKKYMAMVVAVAMVICVMPNMSMKALAVSISERCCDDENGSVGVCRFVLSETNDDRCVWNCTVHEGGTTVEGHAYGHAGYTCELCGHMNTICSHKNIAEFWSNTETEHYKECLGCGEYMETAAHTFSWETTATEHNGHCTICDYVVTNADHSWLDGKCSVCQYTCTHTGMTDSNATCPTCGKANPSYVAPHTHDSSAYGTSATQHWTKCTEDEDNNGTAEDHSWSDGKCSVCQYTCTHGEQTTGTCSTCGKNLGSGSQGSPTPAPTPVSAEQRQREDVELLEYTVSKEEALPVTSFASVAAVNAIPAEAKTGNDLTYNISSVTTIPGFVAAVNKIANASPVSVMSVYSSEPMVLNAAVISAITNTGKTFVYTFTYKGHIYKVTIPAGAKISANGQHFMGPLAAGAQLGTTQIVK